MKIFVSSLISGFEAERRAVKRAVETLRHQAIMAEDFPASPASPQIACLKGLRQSDAVVLVLGDRYGTVQSSGLSATHEEYRAARGNKTVIAFVAEPADFESDQAEFLREVQGWEGGLFRGGYSSPDDLHDKVILALHEYEMANAVGSADPAQLRATAANLLGPGDDNRSFSSYAILNLAIASGPEQQIIRPADLERDELKRRIHKAAAFDDDPFLNAGAATEISMIDDALVLKQDNGSSITLFETGNTLLTTKLDADRDHRSNFMDGSVLIEERVANAIQSSLSFGDWILDAVDPTQRITHLGIAVSINGAEHRAWRTQAEHSDQSNSISMGFGRHDKASIISVDRPRAAIRMGRPNLTEDLLVGLRRRWPRGN